MPYKLEKRGDQTCVMKADTGETVKCHPTREKAMAHMRALEMATANEKSTEAQSEKMVMRISQTECAFEPVSAHVGEACAGCRWYALREMMCHIVDNYPSEIAPNSYCNRFEVQPSMEPMQPEPVPVVIVEPEMHDMAEGEMSAKETPTHKSLIDPIAEWIKSTLLPMFRAEEKLTAGFKAIPDRNVWLAWWTTTTKDLEGEQFAPQAIDDFIARVEKGLTPYPELWFGHMPIRHGQAKWLGRIGAIAVAAGTFDDTPLAQKFVSWYRAQKKDLPVSHGFRYLTALKRNGTYYHFDTFEISPLHPIYMKAANPTAKFNEVMKMDITPEKLQSLTDVLGSDELAKQVAAEAVSALEKKSKEIEGEGVGFKADADAPAIPVIDADARKELDALKAAQTGMEKTLTDAVAKAVKETGETIAKALAAELDKRDATIKTLTEKIEAIEAARKAEQELYAPASQSIITQILTGGKLHEEAQELKKKNAEIEVSKSVVDRFIGGQVVPQG